eukprot:scaffold1588_cov206-Chaetoceros_neogracile.AAC.3
MESSPQQTSEGKAVVAVLAAVLERLVNSNAHVPNGEHVTKFHALKAPAISIKQYLGRVHKYASCSTECFILALIYIDRLIQRNNFILSELNVHRVCITAVLLAAKFFDDAYYNNAYYAKVGGVLVSEMNGLEVEFLFRINFSLHVTPEVFVKYQDELISHAIGAGLEKPAEMSVPTCVQPIAPPDPVLVNVPMPPVPPATVPLNDHSHNWEMRPPKGMAKPQQHLHHQIHQPQHYWPVTSHTATMTEQTHSFPTRYITPSPPHTHHYHPNSECEVSPAYSAPAALHQSQSTTSATNAHQPSDDQDDTRPRFNSFPIDVGYSNPIDVTQFSQKQRIHAPSEDAGVEAVSPCFMARMWYHFTYYSMLQYGNQSSL